MTEHDGKVPNDREKLLKMRGIGPTIADLTLKWAFKEVEGIPID